MSGKQQQPTRYLIVTANRGRLWLQDRLGPYFEAAVVAALGYLFGGVLMIIGHYSEGIIVLIHSSISATILFLLHRAARQQTILLEVTMSYLIHGDKSLLDHLLGRLIAGKWNRSELKPGAALFEVLEGICKNQLTDNWETKRRIAEAIPALGEADAKRALRLVQILRDDWHEARYKSDLRRRAVEALTTPMRKGHLPLIDRVRNEDLVPLLQARDVDQVFTAFAIAETLSEMEQTRPELVRPLQKQLLQFAQEKYSASESEAVEELLEFLSVSRTSDPFKTANRLREMSTHTNEFIRIAAARNLLTISTRLQDDTLDLILELSASNQPKYVRRTIARERSVKFLMEMLEKARTKDKARNILLRLVQDEDQIIRVTTFDMSDALLKSDPSLLKKMCELILSLEETQAEPSQDLIARALRTKVDLAA